MGNAWLPFLEGGATSQTEGDCRLSLSRFETGGRTRRLSLSVVCLSLRPRFRARPSRPRLSSDPEVPGPAPRLTRAPPAASRCRPGPHCGPAAATMSLHGKRKEIYKYEAPWTVYAMNWSVRPDKRFRLALGSFVEEYNNKVGRAGARGPADGESGPRERPFRAGAQTPGPSSGLALAPRSGSSESGPEQRVSHLSRLILAASLCSRECKLPRTPPPILLMGRLRHHVATCRSQTAMSWRKQISNSR